MIWQAYPFALPNLISAAMLALLAVYAGLRRARPGARAFMLLVLGLSLWSLGYGFELTNGFLLEASLWSIVRYGGIAIIPGAWLVFSLQYTGKNDHLGLGAFFVLIIEPIYALVGLGFHIYPWLAWYFPPIDLNNSVITLDFLANNVVLVHSAYASLLLLSGAILLVEFTWRRSNSSAGQASLLSAGILSPWIADSISSTNLIPPYSLDLVPAAFGITCAALASALFGYQLLNPEAAPGERDPAEPGSKGEVQRGSERGSSGPENTGDLQPLDEYLQEIEGKYRALFESSAEAFFFCTSDGKILECNPATLEQFGYSREELLKVNATELVIQESADPTFEPTTQERKNGFSITEGMGRAKTGETFPIEIRNQIVKINNKQYIAVETQDITARKQSEIALRESLSKTRAFYQISRSLATIKNLPDMLQAVVDGIAEALPAERVTLITFDLENEKITHFIRGGKSSDQILFMSFQELMQGLSGWVLRERKPALSPGGRPDARESPRVQRQRLEAGSGAALVVPMAFEDRIMGTLTAVNLLHQPDFSRQDANLLMAVGNQVAMSLQNARLLEEAKLRIQEAETLRQSGSVVTATLQLDETIERILEQLALVVPYDSASVQLLRDGYLEIVGGRGWIDPKSILGIRFPVPSDNPNTKVIEERRPHILGDAPSAHSAFLQAPHSHIRSWLGVPLITNNQVIGMLSLDSVYPDFYTQSHARQATAFADQVAIAVENARQYGSERRRVDELDALRAAMADISTELELPRLLESIPERATTLLDATGGDLGLYDEDFRQVSIVASHNMEADHKGMRINLGEGVIGRIAEAAHPILIEDYRNWPGRSPTYDCESWSTVVAVPLQMGGHLIGAIIIADTNSGRRFSANDQRLLNLFGHQAAIAIQNARHFDAEQSRSREAETLRKAGAAVAATLDQSEAIDKILEQLGQVVPYDSASVQLIRDGQLEILGGWGWPDAESIVGTRYPIPSNNPNTLVIQQRRPRIIEDTTLEHARLSGPSSGEQARSWLGTPLIIHDRVIGMLAVQKQEPNFYQRSHARLITAYADHVAVAIENARLYAAEKQRASQLDALNEATGALLTTIDLESLLNQILASARHAIPKAEKGTLLLVDEISGNLEIKAVAGYADPRMRLSGLPEERGYVIKAVQEKKAILVSNLDDYPEMYYRGEIEELLAIKSAIVAPMKFKQRVLGALSLNASEPEIFGQADLDLLASFAATATAAIRNAQLHAEVQRLAITDSLTNLYNRRGLFELGQRELDRLRRFERPLAAIMLDIDYFKKINDTYSHAIGDQVLQALATRCIQYLRDTDILGRYGGEEFAILLPETDEKSACQVAERLRENMTQSPIQTDRGPISITISLGVTMASGETKNLAILLDRADTAMYAAKQAGRNQVAIG
ncbi:MAG TPA: GAF domain-containing protein [Anaerolineales bacterium]|nr:GAF domain-containing protein [Anaerolineales bacterium]